MYVGSYRRYKISYAVIGKSMSTSVYYVTLATIDQCNINGFTVIHSFTVIQVR